MEGNANEAGLEWDDFFDEPMEEGVEETGVDPAAEGAEPPALGQLLAAKGANHFSSLRIHYFMPLSI